MKLSSHRIVLFVLIAALSTAVATAQTKRKTTKKPVAKTKPTPLATPQPTPEAIPEPPPTKKNERDTDTKTNSRDTTTTKQTFKPAYIYTFDRPGFIYWHVKVEHGEDGKGRIWFKKDGFDEEIDDPIELSAATLERLKESFTALNFLDSTEDYQYSKDFSNMGNITITQNRDGKTRTVKYNWSDNKHAKLLMDTYRAISNEYTWKFEITSARENQPLLTPGLIDSLDSYLRRNEIADPPHLLPYLTQLSTDERLPLIARNHTLKLIKQIEKSAPKK